MGDRREGHASIVAGVSDVHEWEGACSQLVGEEVQKYCDCQKLFDVRCASYRVLVCFEPDDDQGVAKEHPSETQS